MKSLLVRAGALLLAPPEPAAAAFADPVPPQVATAPGVQQEAASRPSRPAASAKPPVTAFAAVLAAPSDVAAVAGAIAANLRRKAGARAAVVCRPGPPFAPRPAWPAATGLARRLADRGFEVSAAGVLCRVALSGDDGPAAVHDAWRLAAVLDVPLVLALPRRLDGFDDLLARTDALHLAPPAGADEALAEVAVASLARLGPPVTRVAGPGTAVARHWAELGLSLPADPERRGREVRATT